jgi:hypothetical protein
MADLMALLKAAVALLLELTSPTRQFGVHRMALGDEERSAMEVVLENFATTHAAIESDVIVTRVMVSRLPRFMP